MRQPAPTPAITATATVMPNCRKKRPMMPCMKATGMNTATMAKVVATDDGSPGMLNRIEVVDPLAVADIQEIVQYLRERGMGILITDHNVRETLQIVDRAYILNSGKILLEGDSQTIANSPIAKKFYLGDNFTL